MNIEQIYTVCLAQGAYYITSDDQAAIIDPLRETQPYMDRLAKDGVQLKYIFETHFHADFVSGHIDLSKKTNADIVFGPNAVCEFDYISAVDNQIFEIGKVKIKVLHTPGHTLESSCYLLIDENGKQTTLFSGDTLFLGDVGRPDLAQKTANLTTQDLAGMLYESLQNKIMPLADEIIVYPAHGAGSSCGKNMIKETVDTLGNQKKTNYALNQPNKQAFISALIHGIAPAPEYFEMNVAMNKNGYNSFENVLKNSMKALSVDEFAAASTAKQVLILDTRPDKLFAKSYIPQAINIGLNGDFAPWVGTLLVDTTQAILLVCEVGKEEEAVTRLSRVGFDKVIGYLANGFEAWEKSGKPTEIINRISPQQFASEIQLCEPKVIDVRKENEFELAHLASASNKPLGSINDWIKDINPEQHFYLHCAGGYRSMMAASILQSKGFRNFTEIEGGFNAIASTNVEISKSETKILN